MIVLALFYGLTRLLKKRLDWNSTEKMLINFDIEVP